MEMLTFRHVTKAFGTNRVIEDLDFSVPQHSVFGFIGVNGAGKTTAMKMALGLVRPDGGEIFVNGERVFLGKNGTNRYIGYLPDVPEFYGFMTPVEYLTMCGEIAGMERRDIRKRAGELLELVGIASGNKRIRGFSRGMKQRLGIAQALLGRPKLLICDEPTSALDPIGRKEILELLSSVKEHTTVVFSTHILSDVERICDRIAFLHAGKIAVEGTLEEMRGIRKGDGLEIEFLRAEDAERAMCFYGEAVRTDKTKLLFTKKNEADMIEIMKWLAENEIPVLRLERLEPALEDLFLEVTGG